MRRFALDAIEGRTFDLAIIGGGVTGASAAREAALRGLSVVLVEKSDFASGTSSRSTKLLHGGLRYLESHEFKLVREACHERELMLKLAPHLSNVRPFIYVLYEGYPESMRLLSAGLSIYDLFSGNPLKRRHRMLPAAALLELETHLNPTGLVGGGLYYDFLTDDARFTIDVLKGAADAGALVGNYLEVTGLPEENGKVAGVSVANRINGETGVVRARQVINTAGPWVDAIRFLEDGVGERLLRPTRGVHVVVRKHDFPLQHAVFVRSPRDNRVVWPIPALDEELVYIGTTDTDYDGPLDHVTATEDDIDYLLEVANFTDPRRRARPNAHRRDLGRPAPTHPARRQHGCQLGLTRAADHHKPPGAADHRRRQADHLSGDGPAGNRRGDRTVGDELRASWRSTLAQRLRPDQRRRPGRAVPRPHAPCRARDRAGGARPLACLRRQRARPRRHRTGRPRRGARSRRQAPHARRGPLRRTGGDGAHGHGLLCPQGLGVLLDRGRRTLSRRCRR